MKTKDLKTYIQSQADKIIIKDYSQTIQMKISNEISPDFIIQKKKKTFVFPTILASLCCIILMSFILFNPYNGIIKSSDNPSKISKAKEILSYEVMALGNMFSSESTSLRYLKNNEIEISEANDIADEVHNYLLTGEMMLNKDNIMVENEVNIDQQYNYENKLSVTYKDQSEYSSNYVLYYTETKKLESDKKIDEVSSYLTGIMLIQNQAYRVTGEKEVEKDEYESSLIIYTSENSYIEISQETEKNENEYKYEYVENNKKVKELSLEVEEKLTKKQMKLEIFENNIEKEFEFEYKKDKILCKYEDKEKEQEYEIEIEVYNEFYLYIFNENLKIKKNK